MQPLAVGISLVKTSLNEPDMLSIWKRSSLRIGSATDLIPETQSDGQVLWDFARLSSIAHLLLSIHKVAPYVSIHFQSRCGYRGLRTEDPVIAMCTLATNTNQRGKNVLDCVICLRSYRNHLRPKGGMSC